MSTSSSTSSFCGKFQHVDGDRKEAPIIRALITGSCDEMWETILRGDRFSHLIEDFPLLCTNKTKFSRNKILQVMKDEFVKGFNQDVERILEESNIAQCVQKRRKILSNYPCDGPAAWRPTGVPEDDVEAHELSVLKSYTESLLKEVLAEEQRTKCLMDVVSNNRTFIKGSEEFVSSSHDMEKQNMETTKNLETESSKMYDALTASILEPCETYNNHFYAVAIDESDDIF